MTVQQLIKNRALKNGNKTFLISPETGAELTFEQLHERAVWISAQFDERDVRVGDHVALLMDNGPWTASLLLSIMASGRIAVPLDVTTSDDQLKVVFEHCDANILFASEQHLERARGLSAGLERPVMIVPTSVDGGPQWDGASEAVGSLPSIVPDTLALLIYTSGKANSDPNGVLLTHRNVVAGARNTVQAHSLSAEDRALCVLPLHYINAEVVTLLAPLLSGGSVVIPYRFSSSAFWRLVQTYQCTWFSVVPTIVDYLLARHETQPADVLNNPEYARVRFGRTASAALPVSSQKSFEQTFGIPLIETMGSTKAAAQILSNPLPPFQSKYGSPGIAYRNEVKVVRTSGRDARSGEIGELLVRGDNVMRKFYKNPTATQRYLTKDGWLRTGDLGYQDETGFFFITGRASLSASSKVQN